MPQKKKNSSSHRFFLLLGVHSTFHFFQPHFRSASTNKQTKTLHLPLILLFQRTIHILPLCFMGALPLLLGPTIDQFARLYHWLSFNSFFFKQPSVPLFSDGVTLKTKSPCYLSLVLLLSNNFSLLSDYASLCGTG